MAFETILPFLRPIAPLLADPTISEIMVNPGSAVFIERCGLCERVPGVEITEAQLRTAIVMIARQFGDDVSEDRPLLDARLPDGSRVAAALPPCSMGGAALTIRKFQRQLFTLSDLVHAGSMPGQAAACLGSAVEQHQNILVSGGTGTGKTTLLNALVAIVADQERVVVIEDTAELQVDKPNCLRFETRREQAGVAGVQMRDLVRATLRHRPDRIIVGEVRGAEAFDLLQALNTGHGGTLTTIHANSAALALNRVTTCVLMSEVGLPYSALRAQIADGVHLVVHIGRRRDGGRSVTEIVRVAGYDHGTDRFALNTVYELERNTNGAA
jgi:pilus assembly protein CpaF